MFATNLPRLFLLLTLGASFLTAVSAQADCVPVDDDGTALIGSEAPDAQGFHTCEYQGAGVCQYFSAVCLHLLVLVSCTKVE